MYVRTYVLLKAKVNKVNLPHCARKYSVACSVRDGPWNGFGRCTFAYPQMGDHPILFSSEEDVLTPGWHSWCVEDYAGGGDSRNDFFYTAITVGSSF